MEIKTLFVTAAASAIAAYTCSKLWAPGTLAAAAFTPVVLAILKDVLSRSTDVVARSVPVRGMVRGAAQPPSYSAPEQTEVRPPLYPPPVVGAPFGDPLAPPVVQPPLGDLAGDRGADPTDRVAQPGEVTYHARGGRRKGLRVAIVTGLLGFLLAAVVLTVPELVAGGSASGNGRGTTFFGGGNERGTETPTTTTTTEQAPAAPDPQTTVTVPTPQEDTTTPTETVPAPGGDVVPPPVAPDSGGAPAPEPVEPPPG